MSRLLSDVRQGPSRLLAGWCVLMAAPLVLMAQEATPETSAESPTVTTQESESVTTPEPAATPTAEAIANTPADATATAYQGEATAAAIDSVSAELGKIRGLLKPVNEATLSSEIIASVRELPFKEGDRFKKGDVLIRFACGRYAAELAAAQAAYTARKKTYDNNAELARYNAAGKVQVEVSEAEANEAAAKANAARIDVSYCTVRAPWDGRVVETKVHKHETVAPGGELVKILDDRNLEMELIVPSRWLTWIKPGTPFRFQVDETGGEYSAKVLQLGARVDPVSQTIRVTGVLETPVEGLLAGMSGTAQFSVPP